MTADAPVESATATAAPATTRAERGPRFSTVVRLGAAFCAILGLFAIALLVVLDAFYRMGEADDEVERLDRAKHAGHHVAALVREQYIHQADTIIARDLSHLARYQEVARHAREATTALERYARTSEEKQLAAESSRLTSKSDDEFQRLTLPALAREDRASVRDLHARTEGLIGEVIRLNQELNSRFEAQSAAARSRAQTLRQWARGSILACFGLAAVVAAGVGTAITRSIVSRASALQTGARRLGAGDLSTRITLHGSDEFAELARSFNEMASAVERHQEQLVRSQKLASVGQMAAGIAHEINNPLGVILGYVRLMRRQGAVADEEGVRVIEEEAMQCQRIVQGLLDLARPQRLVLDPVELGSLARDCVERLQMTDKLDGVTVEAPATGVEVWALGDETKLRQVVINLLTNAVEATPRGGRLSAAVLAHAGEAVLAVIDGGSGVPEKLRTRLFDPFFTTKSSGTGLGLAIAHAIVDAHGGVLRFEAEQGGGTRVSVSLPRAPAPAGNEP